MKGYRELSLLVCLALFLLSPQIPNTILNLSVNTYVGVAGLLFLSLYALRKDMLVGLAAFLVAGSLFLENRKRLVAGDAGVMSGPPSKSQPAPVAELSRNAEPVLETEVHPDFETPTTESHAFEPEGDGNAFRAVGESIDEKHALETAPSNSSQRVAEFFTAKAL